MTSVEDLIKSLHGGAHVNQDLQALQEYLSQNLQNSTSAYHANNTTFRTAPSRSTSSTRPPPLHLAHSHSHSHDSYHQQPYATPLVQTPFPGEDPSQSTSTLVRPHALRRSSSYGFGFGSQPSSPYTEYTAFEGDAFAPLVQPECPADPWARWKQPGNTENTNSVWSAFTGNQSQINGFGTKQNSQLAGQMFGARFQSPVRNRVERVPTPPDEDDEMMDTDMDMGNEMEDDEDAVERQMSLEDSGTMNHIPRPDSAPGAIEMGSMGWRGEGFDAWGRGRRKL